jgi:hypothetical protein
MGLNKKIVRQTGSLRIFGVCLVVFCLISSVTSSQTILKFGPQGFTSFLPTGWARQSVQGNNWALNGSDAADGDNYCAYLSGSSATKAWLFTESFTAVSGFSYYLKYFDKYTSSATNFEIYVGSGTQQASNATVSSNLRSAATASSWPSYPGSPKQSDSWTCTSSGTYWFGIYVYTPSSNIKLDAISCYETALEPTTSPASFTASASSTCTQIDLNFSAANTITYAKGYLILQKTGSSPTGVPADGNAYGVGSTIGDASVAAVITNASAVSTTITALSGLTNYYFSIIPYNYNGSNSATYNYKTSAFSVTNATTISCGTITTEPSSQPASFTVNYSSNCKQLDLSFSAASTITNAYGYLILRKQGSSSSSTPSDQNAYSLGSTIGDATVIANITNTSSTSLIETGLSDATAYYYSIFPYNYDGSMSTSYNYRTSGYHAANETTIFCNVLVGTSVGGDSPGSGWDDPNAINGNYSNWWSAHLYTKNDMHNEMPGAKGSSVHNVIKSICLDLHPSDPNWNSSTVTTTLTGNKIYLANFKNSTTLAAEYTNETDLDNEVTTAGYTWTLVYSGDITFTGYGWNQITLNTPYYYTGSGSLLVKFTRTSGTTTPSGKYPNYGYLNDPNTSDIRQCSQTGTVSSYKYVKIVFNSTCSNGLILPIELSAFNGACTKNKINLSWSTSSETNNNYFTIEKSIDFLNWDILTIVPGAGNSNVPLNYSVTDDEINAGIMYYRLKQTDFDGKYSYSDVIAVAPCSSEHFDMVVVNNPAHGNMNILINTLESQDARIYIQDMLGRVVYQRNETLEKGFNTINIDVTGLGDALYVISVEPKDNGQPVMKKIIIDNQ